MRILFATYTLASQNPNSGEKVMSELKRGLEKRGHQVGVFDPWQTRVKEWDLVHFFSMIESSAWAHFKGPDFTGRLVVTPNFYRPPDKFGRLFPRTAGRGRLDPGWRTSLPDYWIAGSDREKVSLAKSMGVATSRISVIPSGVAPHFAEGDAETFRKKYGIPGPFILHVGRFHPVKNHLLLAEAARQAKATLVCIGEPVPDRTDYFLRCARTIADQGGRVIRGLTTSDPLLAGAYAAAQAFALPSEFETFGLNALEAAVAGTPLILSSELQAREIYPEAQWIDPRDLDNWVIAIQRALRTPRPERTLASKQARASRFTWDGVAEKTETVYRTLVP